MPPRHTQTDNGATVALTRPEVVLRWEERKAHPGPDSLSQSS
jgi:hypothetical protein